MTATGNEPTHPSADPPAEAEGQPVVPEQHAVDEPFREPRLEEQGGEVAHGDVEDGVGDPGEPGVDEDLEAVDAVAAPEELFDEELAVAACPDDEDEDAPQPQVIVTEALGPRLSRRSVLVASGVAVAFALGTGLLAGVAESRPDPVEMSSLTNSSATEVSPRDSSGVAERATASVFRIQVGSQSGSSFLVEQDTLMTNAHVTPVEVGETVEVTSPDGESIDGTVLMKDTAVDIALVEIPKQKAEPLPLVGVQEQSAGQPVSLVGYPLGLDVSVTSGVASSIDTVTNLRESSGQHSLLQIDAAVNPGSSGGPVLDSRGRVMGMATSRPDTVGSRPVQGIAFAVPSNDLVVATRQYNEHGDVSYGYLGVSLQGGGSGGAKVKGVTDGSPAESVGLKKGDVIVAVGGYPTDSYTEVSRYLHMFRPGDEVELSVKTGKKSRTVTVVLGDAR